MENKGKQFEKVIWLIQETLKDSLNTKIHLNYNLTNQASRKREFDIFIETSTSGISINISIECKSNKRPISVKEIEAFYGKCSRHPIINKMVFVSQSGYQRI